MNLSFVKYREQNFKHVIISYADNVLMMHILTGGIHFLTIVQGDLLDSLFDDCVNH